MCFLPAFLQWVRRTKKSCNLSSLISDSVPKSGGEKGTKRKGAPKKKQASKQPCLSVPPTISDETSAESSSDYQVSMHQSPFAAYPLRATSFQPFSPSFASASPFGYQVQSPVMCAPSMNMYQHPSTSPSFVGSNYGPSPIGSSQTSPGSEPSSTPMFWIQSLKGTRIRMCYGCKSPMRTDTSIVPLPPYDFVIGYKERRWY